MTRVLSSLRSLARSKHALRVSLGLALAIVAWGCADKVVGPRVVVPSGNIGVYADVGPAGVTTLVIQVSGPGIVKPDNSPDTLSFNIPLENGVASGSLAVPAGADRVITARAFVGITESHRGSITTNIIEGVNPTLHITMVPLVGDLPLTVSIGSTIVIVRPLVASVAVGDTIRMTSEIRDHNGTLVNEKVRWATLNPLRASVDTAGLVTVRDTGEVQIVGTYGTVGGSAKLTGVAVASVSPIHLTWNGSVNTKWEEPNNWTPHGLGAARAPTLSDSVVIPAGAPRMPTLPCIEDDNAVRDILVEEGATLNSPCYALNVYGSAVVRGSITTVFTRPNAKLAGKFGDLYIKGTASLIDSVVATWVRVEGAGTNLALNQHRLRTTTDFNVASSATVTMVDGDTLIVGGNVSWNGGDQNGLLTGGVVFVRGTSFSGGRYYGTGTSRLVLDRITGTTQLSGFDYLNQPNNSLIRRLEIKSGGGAIVCGYIRVSDTLSLVSTGTPSTLSRCSSYYLRVDGPIITSVNTDVDVYLVDIRHASGTSLVAGTWQADYTDIHVDNPTLNAALGYENLRFFANHTLAANTTITGHLYLEGAAVELNLGGKKLTVGDYLEVQNGATLKMSNAADSLIVGHYGYFPDDFHATQKPKLTAGVISIGAYLYGFGFASAGTKLVMAGTSPDSKYISGMNYESRPAQELYDLEYAGATYGVCERTKVAHNLVVKAGATVDEVVCGSGYLTVVGDLITEAGSTLSPHMVMLNTAVGTSHVLGAYSPEFTDFNVPNAVVKPGLAYGNMRFFASTQLSGATTATGYVYASGNGVDLAINGNTLTVGNYLQLDNNSTLTMTNAADSVIVANYGYFNSNTSVAQEAKLTAGVLSIGEYLYGFGFSASGTHKVLMAGTSANSNRYINGMNYESRPAQGMQNLEIAAGKSYGVCERLLVKGTLTVAAGATFDNGPCGSPYLRIDGDVVSAVTSTIAPYNVALHTAFGTQHVDGTFSPEYTSLHTTAAAGQLKAGLGYKSVQFFTPASLSANMTVNGELNVSGASAALTLNGKTLTVTGNLNVTSNGIIVMDNASDVLDIGGNVSWSGSGSEVGKLTNGTAIFRGATVCASKYETSVAHKTIFQRGLSDPVRFQCVASSSTSPLMHDVDIKGSGVALECSMNVGHDLRVFAGSSLTMSTGCGSGTLYVANNLVSDLGSAIANGANYPGSSQLTVSLAGATGTQNVSGAYSAHFTVFSALNAYIQPTLVTNGMDYKHARIDQSTIFQDSTEFDGGLEIINTAIVDLNGNTVVVKGSMDLINSARLRMVSTADTLVVGSGDSSADLFWDAGDNSTDGMNPLLTAGAVKFFGDRFVGTQYKATVSGTNHHRFIFMSPAGGTVSVESSPRFSVMEIRTPRALANNSSNTWVQDSLIMGVSATYGGGNSLEIDGDIVTGASSDISVSNVFVDGPNGTSLVTGRFRPTNASFRSPSPSANAIKGGLEYQNVSIQTGQYALNATTGIALDLDLSSSGRLTVNGKTLNVGGAITVNSTGGFVMSQSTDAVTTGGTFQVNNGQVGTTLSGGTLTVSGNYNIFSDVAASGTHKLVMTGSSAKTISSLNGTARALNNLDISGTGTVNFSSGIVVNGALQVLSATSVSGSSSTLNGPLSTVAGSSFTHSNLTLSDAAGTSNVAGNMSITGTITFATGTQSIKSGLSYANMTIGGSATVAGGSLAVPGTLTINSGASLEVPTASSLNTVNVSGTISFLGTSVSTGVLTVNNGGSAEAAEDLSPTAFVDFARILLNNGGTMNNGDRNTGDGGFRYRLSGAPNSFQNNNPGGGYNGVSGATPFATLP